MAITPAQILNKYMKKPDDYLSNPRSMSKTSIVPEQVIASGRAQDRAANAAKFGDSGRLVASNIPMRSPSVAGSGVLRVGNTQLNVNPDNTITSQTLSGQPVTVAQGIQRSTPGRRQPIVTPAGTRIRTDSAGRVSARQKVGNMDVTFANDTDNAARMRFMEDPVDPIAQDIQYQKRVQAEQDRINAQPVQTTRTIGIDDGPDLITQVTHPGMGWHQRTALNQKILENYQASKSNIAAAEREAMTQSGANTRAGLEAQVNREKNAVDAMTAQSTQGLTAAQTKQYEIENRVKEQEAIQAETISALQDQAINGTPDEQAKANAKLKAIGAVKGLQPRRQVVPGGVINQVDPVTGRIISVQAPTTIVDPDSGTYREVQPETPPSVTQEEALASLAKYKGTPREAEARAAFIRKHGPIPEGY